MKSLPCLLFAVFVLISPLSTAQNNDKCLDNFTHDYFDWFKGGLRSSPSGTIVEITKAKKRELEDLFELLDTANNAVCSPKHELQISELVTATKRLYQTFDVELKKASLGESPSAGEELRKAKSQYRAYNAKLVKQLMKETGIRW